MSSDQPAERESEQQVGTGLPNLTSAADATPTTVMDHSHGDDLDLNQGSGPMSDDGEVGDSCSEGDDVEPGIADDETNRDHSDVTEEKPKSDVRSHGDDPDHAPCNKPSRVNRGWTIWVAFVLQ